MITKTDQSRQAGILPRRAADGCGLSSVGDEKPEPLSSGIAVSIRITFLNIWRGNSSIGVAIRVFRALLPLVCLSGSGLFDAGEAT